MSNSLIEKIEALLPQTQCGLCGYQGCRPYAEAIVLQQAEINRCPPGGMETLTALAKQLAIDEEPLQAALQQKLKSPRQVKIREAECIGCTKCIQACPVDAIIGTAKHMHVVLQTECTGCELCIEPCPVDCIDIVPIAEHRYSPSVAKARYLAKQHRLSKQPALAHSPRKIADQAKALDSIAFRQEIIQAALARVKKKRQL